LVQIAAAVAAAIDLLQTDEIMLGDQFGDMLQIVENLLTGQDMAPAACHILVITLGTHAHLHVETQQRKCVFARYDIDGGCPAHARSLPPGRYRGGLCRADIVTQGIVPPMKQSSVLRIVLRRALLLVVLAGVAAVVVVAGWRAFMHRVGGYFPYAPEDATWVLTERAQALVTAAFADVGDAPVIDYQVGVIAMGGLADSVSGETNYYRRDRAGQAGPLAE